MQFLFSSKPQSTLPWISTWCNIENAEFLYEINNFLLTLLVLIYEQYILQIENSTKINGIDELINECFFSGRIAELIEYYQIPSEYKWIEIGVLHEVTRSIFKLLLQRKCRSGHKKEIDLILTEEFEFEVYVYVGFALHDTQLKLKKNKSSINKFGNINHDLADQILQSMRGNKSDCSSNNFQARNQGNMFIPIQEIMPWCRKKMKKIRYELLNKYFEKEYVLTAWENVCKDVELLHEFKTYIKNRNFCGQNLEETVKLIHKLVLQKSFNARFKEVLKNIEETILHHSNSMEDHVPLRERLKHLSTVKRK